jgi:hypothetical protein
VPQLREREKESQLLAQSGERKAQESWVHRMREIEGTRATVVFFFFLAFLEEPKTRKKKKRVLQSQRRQ